MAFTGTTYAELSASLDEIAEILRDETASLQRSKTAFSSAASRLNALLQTYSGIDTVANALLTAAPSNVELQATFARLQLLIQNRQALHDRSVAMQNAVANL